MVAILIATTSQAQYNTSWTQNTSNSSQNGYIGIGTSPTANSNTVKPNFNFQIHGVSNFTFTPPTPFGQPPANPVNYGISSRFGLTNSVTGSQEYSGGLLLMAEENFIIRNQEDDGDLKFLANNVAMTFSGSTHRIYVGGNPNASQDYGRFNIVTSDNGLSIRSNVASKYALRLKVANDNSNLIEAFGSDNTAPNFQVTGAGNVYARRYITTLNPFPDYVFQPNYKLRTFSELRTFINTHKHLPNMPTATEVDKNGADLGEINRVLVEKVEELTLYILELEARVVEVEATDELESALQERITRLEEIISNLSED